MKIFIFAYDRYETMTTSEYFKGIPHVVLCHSVSDMQKFANGGRCTSALMCTDNPRGLAIQRNFALGLMKDGEWGLFMVDDLTNIKEFDEYDASDKIDFDIYDSGEYSRKFNKEINAHQFMIRCQQLTQKADAEGISLIGFTDFTNALFRKKKYIYNKMVQGRAVLIKKNGLLYSPEFNCLEDFYFTCLTLEKTGKTLSTRWIHFNCKDNPKGGKGGYGTLSDRQIERNIELEKLMQMYPKYLEKVQDKKDANRYFLKFKRTYK